MFDLTGKRALVTGASQGLGAGIAKALAAANALVILSARSETRLQQIKQSIDASGGKAEVRRSDLSSRAGCRALAASCGDIDILVNNAAQTTLTLRGVAEPEDDVWDMAVMMNLIAPKTLMECFCPGMIQRRSGVVINISSMASRFTPPNTAPYSTMKAALEQLTRIAAMEMAPSGVRVNAVTPGNIATAALDGLFESAPGMREAMIGRVPAGRLGTVEEIGNLCVFLASDEAAYINGSVHVIDGGATAGTFFPTR
ncbi:MAG: SDR family NAD(P)-dependent oxidoreductase [Steroidobacteraceae bacterium]